MLDLSWRMGAAAHQLAAGPCIEPLTCRVPWSHPPTGNVSITAMLSRLLVAALLNHSRLLVSFGTSAVTQDVHCQSALT